MLCWIVKFVSITHQKNAVMVSNVCGMPEEKHCMLRLRFDHSFPLLAVLDNRRQPACTLTFATLKLK